MALEIDPSTIHSKKTKVNSKIINLVIPCLWPPKSNVVKVMPPIDNSCDAADSTKIRKIQVYCVHTLPLICTKIGLPCTHAHM